MSSYLSIYIKPTGVEKKVLLFSFSRSSDIYQFFWENNLSCYAYSSNALMSASEKKEEQFKELDNKELQASLVELSEEIVKDEKKLAIMEKHSSKTSIQDIISLQEYIEEQKTLQNDIRFIQLLLPNGYNCNEVEAVYTNID